MMTMIGYEPTNAWSLNIQKNRNVLCVFWIKDENDDL